MKELEDVVHTMTDAKVCMPSYDGLLLKHAPDSLDMDELKHAWQHRCMGKWGYHFPIKRKDYMEDLPSWLPRIVDTMPYVCDYF